jgi:hypothetical protein
MSTASVRQIRKGDTVRLKPNIFLLQKADETARVKFVYRRKAHVMPPLNGNSFLHVESLERVLARSAS